MPCRDPGLCWNSSEPLGSIRGIHRGAAAVALILWDLGATFSWHLSRSRGRRCREHPSIFQRPLPTAPLGASRRSGADPGLPSGVPGMGEGGNSCLAGFIPLGMVLEASSLPMSYSKGVRIRRSGVSRILSLAAPGLEENQSLKLSA